LYTLKYRCKKSFRFARFHRSGLLEVKGQLSFISADSRSPFDGKVSGEHDDDLFTQVVEVRHESSRIFGIFVGIHVEAIDDQ
jgi:hypothetical protein